MSERSLLDPPSPTLRARFKAGFGQRALLTIDTEEEFDWTKPLSPTGHRVDHLMRIEKFQEFCEGIGVIPVYLVDWPVVSSGQAREIFPPLVTSGRAELGVQLHPWVNPPQRETVTAHNSFAGNLPPELEQEKFDNLVDAIEQKLGVSPLIYRAGRYGVGDNTAAILKQRGIAIDTSVRPHHDYSEEGGPDFSRHPNYPYWSDEQRSLLEIPLTTCYWGMLRRQGAALQPLVRKFPGLGGALARTAILERIPLTPEGTTREEAIRCIDIALDDGLELLVLSLHSPSLVPGHTPYVRDEDDVDALYDWLRAVYGYFELRGVKPTSVGEIMQQVEV